MKSRGPRGRSIINPNFTGLRPKRRGNVEPQAVPIQYPPRQVSEIDKTPIAPISGPSTGIRAVLRPPEEKMGGHHFRYTPVNLTVYTAAYSGAVSGLVGSSRWLLDSTLADYVGFTRIAGAFAMSFDLAWEADPNTNPPNTLQVFVIEKTCKAVWEDRDVLANSTTTNSSTFTAVSEAIIALILASEEYFAGQGITPAPWPSGGGGGVTAVLPGVGIGITGPIDTPTVNNEGVLAVDAAAGIGVSTVSGVATVSNTGILAVDAAAGIGVSTVSGVATVSNTGILAVDSGTGITASTVSGIVAVALAGVRTPWTITAFFVDPSNVSGHASDSNDGLTATTPILTTAEFNKRIFLHDVQVDCIVTYMSDDIGQVQLDLSTVSIGLGTLGSLTFQGTPQVLHTGGTINAGTIAINPSAPGGGQRQVLHTSDISDFTPYVIPLLGGTASHPCYVQDSVTGDSAWIVSAAVSASPSMSRPVHIIDSETISAGTISIGHGYTIQRGSTLSLALIYTPVLGADVQGVTFQDFAFDGFSSVFLSNICTRCSFSNFPFFGSTDLNHCFLGLGIINLSGADIPINAGVLVTTADDFSQGLVSLSGDVYVTGDPFFISQGSYSNVTTFAGIGAGIQFQDIQDAKGALLISAGIFATDTLLWGNGNMGPGITMFPGGILTVTVGDVPSVTGSQDFAFYDSTGQIYVARAWNETVGAYTEAGGVPTRATTWANFIAPIGSGGFDYQAHDVSTEASIVGIIHLPN